MIVIVEQRGSIGEAFISGFRRLGMTAVCLPEDDAVRWLGSVSLAELEAVVGILLAAGIDRVAMLRHIRTRTTAPVIALNEQKCLAETLELLAAGFDDVVAKPVHVRELAARLETIRRRGRQGVGTPIQGAIQLFADGRDVVVADAELALPRRERRILECLFRARGAWVTKSQIFNQVYGLFDDDLDHSVVEAHVCRLRKRLKERLGYDPINSQRFLGYRLVAEDIPCPRPQIRLVQSDRLGGMS